MFDIADQVAARVNAKTNYTRQFECLVDLPGKDEMGERLDLTIRCLPVNYVSEPASRSDDDRDVQINVAVQQHLPSENKMAEVRDLHALTFEIAHQLDRWSPEGATYFTHTIDPVFDPQHLIDKRLFTSVIQLTYRLC